MCRGESQSNQKIVDGRSRCKIRTTLRKLSDLPRLVIWDGLLSPGNSE